MNDSPENAGKDKPWVLVAPGLFHYPLVNGQAPALLASRCKKCEKSFFPKRRLCPTCFETDMEEIRLNTRGRIYSAAVVHIPSPTGIKAPYAYGYVDITANNIRVFALFTGADPDAFVPGREVEMVLEPISENSQGHEVIGHKFRLVF